jgi:hypothetical protein
MKQLLVMMFLFPILIFVVIQPFYQDMNSMRGMMLEGELNRAINQVAVKGMLTTIATNGSSSIEQSIKNNLSVLKFDPNKVVVNSTTKTSPINRGLYVDLEIQYPRPAYFIFNNFWGSDGTTSKFVYRATAMSEYIP